MLLGAASPTDLIKNPRLTPFNIAEGVTLKDFRLEEAAHLQDGLDKAIPGEGHRIFQQIYHWTDGHPYLTQRFCKLVIDEGKTQIASIQIDEIAEENFLAESARGEANARDVQDRILNHPQQRQLLGLYRRIVKGQRVADDSHSVVQNQLKLSGLVKSEKGYLQVRNRIYADIFDATWVRTHTKINWARVTAVVSTLVALLTISIFTYNYWVETEKNEAVTNFFRASSSPARLTHLTKLFQLRLLLTTTDYTDVGRELFFGLTRDEQLALFDPYIAHAKPTEMIAVTRGLYINLADVDGSGSTTPLLEAMATALTEAGHADQRPMPWQSSRHWMERFFLRRDVEAERQQLQQEMEHWLAGRKFQSEGRRRTEDALAAYNQAITLNPDNPALLYERAGVLAVLGLYPDALRDLDQVIGIAQLTPAPTVVPTDTPLPTLEATPSTIAIHTATPTPTRTRTTNFAGPFLADPEVPGAITPFSVVTPTSTPTVTPLPAPTPTSIRISSAFVNRAQRVSAVETILDTNLGLARDLYNNAAQYQNLRDFGLIPTATHTPLATSTPTVTPTPTVVPPGGQFVSIGSTLDVIRVRGYLIAGVKGDTRLFGFRNEGNGTWEGFEVDLMREFADRWLGDPDLVEFVQVISSDRIPRLLAGDVDLIAATMTHSKSRDETIDFSQTYFLDGQNILVRRDAAPLPASDVERIKWLAGKRIAAVNGSTSIKRIVEFARGNNITIEIAPFEQYSQAIEPLLQGTVDALTIDRGILAGVAQVNPELMILLSQNFSSEPFGMGVRPGDSLFTDLVNYTLQEIKADGTYDALHAKWFCPENTDEATCPAPYAIEQLPGTPPFTFAEPLTITVTTQCEPVIEKMIRDGYFVAGVKADVRSFGYIDADTGARSGFEIELMREFARRWLGNTDAVEFVTVTSANRIIELNECNIDLIAATMTHSKARDLAIDFSQTYYLDGQNVLVRRAAATYSGTDEERARQLNGKRIGAIQGSTSLNQIQAFATTYEIEIEIVEFEQYNQAIQPLLDGNIDGLTTDRGILTGLAQQIPELAILFTSNFSNEPYALGIPQGDHRFRDLVNVTLQEMKLDGTYDQLYRYWFGVGGIMQEAGRTDAERIDLIQRYWTEDPINPVTEWQPFPIEIWPGVNYFINVGQSITAPARNDLAPMVFVPGGESYLGTTRVWATDVNQHPGLSAPQLVVTHDPFYIDQHEVTNHQYRQCVDLGLCGEPVALDILTADYFYADQYRNHPVVNVTWDQAQNYCAVFGKSLPTEAQWETAARFGANAETNFFYPWGDSDTEIALRATYANSIYRQDYANPVGLYRFDLPASFHGFSEPIIARQGASTLGILDLAGSVQEWTTDCYDQQYYANLAAGTEADRNNPTNQSCDPNGDRTVRSSGFYDQKYTLLTIYRQGKAPDSADLLRGFRCVAAADSGPVTRLHTNSD